MEYLGQVLTIASVNVERFERRPHFLTSVVGMLLTFAILMGLSAGFAMTKKAAMGRQSFLSSSCEFC